MTCRVRRNCPSFEKLASNEACWASNSMRSGFGRDAGIARATVRRTVCRDALFGGWLIAFFVVRRWNVIFYLSL
jgi:hypothetical protein